MTQTRASGAQSEQHVERHKASGGGGNLKRALRGFRHRNFTIFWSGALASNIGSWVQNMTVPYVLYELSDSAFLVGMATFLQFVPQLVFGPIGGTIADRANRRRTLMLSQSGLAVVAILMWLMWATGVHQVWVILGLVGLGGVIGAMNVPTWQAFVNDLIDDPADLVSAITLNSVQFNASRAVGPAIAGVILATAGPSWAFLVNAFSFVFVLLALAMVRPVDKRRPNAPKVGVLRGFMDAVAYARVQRGILAGLTITVFVGFLGNPLQSLTVVFAKTEFDAGPIGLALLNVVLGVGTVIAFFIVSGWDNVTTRSKMIRIAVLFYSCGIVVFSVMPYLWLALLPLVVVGGGFLAVISIANSTTQFIVADHIRGRVMALRIMCFSGSYPLGSLLQGWVTDLIGVRLTVGTAGALLVLFAVWLNRVPLFVGRLDDPHDEAEEPEAIITGRVAPAAASGN